MSGTKDMIADVLRSVGARHGFQSVGANNYYCETPETVGLVNLQRSAFGSQFYLNGAVWLKRFGDNRRPKEHKCQVRWRISSLLPDVEAKELAKALDLEWEMQNEARRATVEYAAERFGFALIIQHPTEKSLLEAGKRFGPSFAITRQVLDTVGAET